MLCYHIKCLWGVFMISQLAEVVSERDLLKQQQSQHASKGIRDLEKINRVIFYYYLFYPSQSFN